MLRQASEVFQCLSGSCFWRLLVQNSLCEVQHFSWQSEKCYPGLLKRIKRYVFLECSPTKCIKMEDEFFNNQKTVANVESKCPWYPYDQTLPVTIGPRPHSTQVANNILNSPDGPNGPKRWLTSDALFDRSHFWLMGPSLFGPGFPGWKCLKSPPQTHRWITLW